MTSISRQSQSGYADQFAFCDNALKSFETIPDNNHVKHKTISIRKGAKKINISIIMDPITQTALSYIYRTQFRGVEHIIIGHAISIRTDTIFNKIIQPLYNEIFNTHDTRLIYRNLGKIVWYLSPIAALDGGSAATSLMFIYEIMNRKNLPLRRIDSDISLDLLAIFQPDVDKFSHDFEPLMSKSTTNSCQYNLHQ